MTNGWKNGTVRCKGVRGRKKKIMEFRRLNINNASTTFVWYTIHVYEYLRTFIISKQATVFHFTQLQTYSNVVVSLLSTALVDKNASNKYHKPPNDQPISRVRFGILLHFSYYSKIDDTRTVFARISNDSNRLVRLTDVRNVETFEHPNITSVFVSENIFSKGKMTKIG